MRTTLTLDDDVASLVRRLMSERGISFKDAVNQAIRAGLTADVTTAPVLTTFDMGEPKIGLDAALRLAGEIEDDELARRLSVGR